MASVAEIRKQYPQYNDLSDQQLADALYQTHYSDMPREQFDAAVGVAPRRTSQALGFAEGIRKPLDNAALAVDSGLRSVGVPTDAISHAVGMPGAREANANAQTAMRQAERTSKPGAVGRFVGEVAGTLPVALVTHNPFLAGAGQGALLTDARTPGGVAVDAGLGGVLGHFGGKAIDAAADFIKPVIDPAVRMLNDAGVKLTPGMVRGGKAMIREDKAMSRPVVGDAIRADRQATQDTFNTATVDQVLAPLGVKVPAGVKPGFDAVSFAKQKVGEAYDRVVPNLAVQLNSQQFVQNVGQVARNLKPTEQQQLSQIVSNELGNGQLSGQTLKRAQGEIRRLAGKYSRSQNANEQLLGEALGAVDDELTSAMVAQNPKFAGELQRANTAYRGYRVLADAASRADDGVINTGQLKQAVRRGDFSKSKDASARGAAFLQDWSNAARDVIPARTPDSGTAGRQQASSLFAKLGGAADAAGYQASSAYNALRLAPRPAASAPAANALKRLKAPIATGFVAGGNALRN